jgi:hypothetical protein
MPRPLGIFLIAVASLLFGVYAWFGLVWLLSGALDGAAVIPGFVQTIVQARDVPGGIRCR